jgi:hypothetical protein
MPDIKDLIKVEVTKNGEWVFTGAFTADNFDMLAQILDDLSDASVEGREFDSENRVVSLLAQIERQHRDFHNLLDAFGAVLAHNGGSVTVEAIDFDGNHDKVINQMPNLENGETTFSLEERD